MNSVAPVIEKLIDQEARDRFVQEIDQNFSVIAPAGVGKTTAIVQRITTIARNYDHHDLAAQLSKLVVVTYTQKAADEMKNRSYQALLQTDIPFHHLQEFNKAFFGTIHSFCNKLIQNYGFKIGLPNNLSLVVQDEPLWQEFLNLNANFSDLIPGNIRNKLCQYVHFDKLIQVARKISLESLPKEKLIDCPIIDLSSVLNYTSSRSSQKVSEIQNELKAWLAEHEDGPFALGIPDISQGDSEFKERCAEAFSPLWNWLGEAAHLFAFHIAKKYQDFRIAKGMITYDDMIDLAAKLIKYPDIADAIRSLDYHVILDEAQDTDSKQFAVLLGVVQLDEESNPLNGRFSMLGDPQQAIYSSRADLPTYLKIHNHLCHANNAQVLTFNVTMRCDRNIVAHCNAVFPNILKNNINESQINFVPLNARPWAQEGYVGKIVLEPSENVNIKQNTNDLEQIEAELLAKRIRELGFKGLDIKDWNEVAILAPRKNWLFPIAKALEKIGISVQVHSSTSIKGDNPAFAWICALLTIITEPNNSFEIVGVLREIFGLSDDSIAQYIHSRINNEEPELHPLNLAFLQSPISEGKVGYALHSLFELRNEVLERALSQAIQVIIEKIDLKERLLSLPSFNKENLLKTLDEILMQAVLQEEQGTTLLEFSSKLKNNYYNSDDLLEVLKGHIQCFTSHKAKGLEWPVVIVPFLFRSILFPAQEYPQVIQLGSNSKQKIFISNHPDKKQFEELLERHRTAELERLLYVTATRPRQKLLWVDDEALFKNSKNSFASLLNIAANGSNRRTWNQLSDFVPSNKEEEESEVLYKEVVIKIEESNFEENFIKFDPNIIATASNRSKAIFQRLVPSQLNKSVALKNNFEKTPKDYASIDYGNWWHTMMETLPWGTKVEWKSYCADYLIQCPAPTRGQKEIELFFKSASLQTILNDDLIIQTEVPFLCQKEGKICYEGFIDFLGFNTQKNHRIIIDWKTDLFDYQDDSENCIKKAYCQQLEIYQEAIKKVYGSKPEIYLYSTYLGELFSL